MNESYTSETHACIELAVGFHPTTEINLQSSERCGQLGKLLGKHGKHMLGPKNHFHPFHTFRSLFFHFFHFYLCRPLLLLALPTPQLRCSAEEPCGLECILCKDMSFFLFSIDFLAETNQLAKTTVVNFLLSLSICIHFHPFYPIPSVNLHIDKGGCI